MLKKLFKTDQDQITTLIRLMVGAVFLSEGVQKFVYTAVWGIGRFEKMGFPNATFFAYSVW